MKKKAKKIKVTYEYVPSADPEDDKRALERAFDVLFEAVLEENRNKKTTS